MTEPIETGSVAARIVEAMLKAGVDASPDGFKGDVAVVVEHGRTLVAGGTHREADRMRSALRRAAGARPAGRGVESLTESLKRAEADAELVAVRVDDGEGGPFHKVSEAMINAGAETGKAVGFKCLMALVLIPQDPEALEELFVGGLPADPEALLAALRLGASAIENEEASLRRQDVN